MSNVVTCTTPHPGPLPQEEGTEHATSFPLRSITTLSRLTPDLITAPHQLPRPLGVGWGEGIQMTSEPNDFVFKRKLSELSRGRNAGKVAERGMG